jgi:NADH-quinone oxidoreductase subunit G
MANVTWRRSFWPPPAEAKDGREEAAETREKTESREFDLMPTLTIDGQKITVEAGTTVIQAAEQLGIYIPRYCYHPGLSIAGSCRMCFVEVENIPNLQISCNTVVRDDMVVWTSTERVQTSRRQMLEFLLTDHPLDCPVCDQSGECDLQNFYMTYGRYDSRFYEDKTKRKKGHVLGPHVVLDQERCILCSRCIRFTEEITESHELGIFNRGSRSVVDLGQGKTLDNPYSANVVDICPVGALTEREFRFQCGVWYLSSEKSICTGCSRGCNISVHYNGTRREHKAGGRRVQRLKPRFNPHVNQWWICDEGRFGFTSIDENRIELPHLRRGGELVPVDWDTALEEVSRALRTTIENYGADHIGVIASPQQSTEELYLVRKLFAEHLKTPHLGCVNPKEPLGGEDSFLRRSDRNPNSAGARMLGLEGNTSEVLARGASGDLKIAYIFSHDFEDESQRQQLTKTETIIFQGPNWNSTAEAAHVVLPSAVPAETDGTFINFEGRLQRFYQVLLPIEEARDGFNILSDLAEKLGHPWTYEDAEGVFAEWQDRTYEELDEFGEVLETSGARQAG